MGKEIVEGFRFPGSEYRGAPFWAWNGTLNPEELRRQVRLMHRMGLGGFFMHSRVGLNTPYLSDEWFECVNACIDEAERLDMQAWLYDEDRWPSGAAGGLVTKNPKHRMRSVVVETVRSPRRLKWTAGTIAAFVARVRGKDAYGVRRLKKGSRPGKLGRGEVVLTFRVETQRLSSWHNGYTYLDTMSHEAVREFIRVTHETYRKRIGRTFGKRVPGIFTDEPNYGHTGMRRRGAPGFRAHLPWTPKLPAVFRKRYGYDLLPHLVELVLDLDGNPVTRARYHYHECITHLFVDAFAKQIGKWCERNNMQHTGHTLGEDNLAQQTAVVGSTMRFYEYMQAPGMDLLTQYFRAYTTAKQVSSVARQFGRRWRLTETYGCTGWDFPFEGHKALGDWQAALGINLRCQHLSWYTMEGQAKRDYPAGIFYQSPWWSLYGKVEDYYARIHAAMTKGTEVRDLLVIHPIESAWLYCRCVPGHDIERRDYSRMLERLSGELLSANIDFDYGEEDILRRHARVSGRGKNAVLKVGKATYRAVAVPPLLTMRASTLRLLGTFRAAGGQVVFAGKAPAHVNAVPSDGPAKLARECESVPRSGKGLAAVVEERCRRVSIRTLKGKEIDGTLHLLREDRDAFYLFICNTGHSVRSNVLVEKAVRDRRLAFPTVIVEGLSECRGRPVELDPQTGESSAASAKRGKNGWQVKSGFPRLGSRLFVFPKRASRLPAKPYQPLRDVRRSTLKGTAWDISLSEANCLVLDRPAFRIGSGAWKKPDEVLRVDFAVREALGIPRRGGHMVQPWARPAPTKPRRVGVELCYRFRVETEVSGDLWLALERPDTFCVRVNGVEIDRDAEGGWWCDRSLRRLPVDASLLRRGENEITMLCDYDETHPGLEIAYLLGNFGTKVRGTELAVTAPPTKLRIGNWVPQGLAFYSGSVTYRRKIRPKRGKGARIFVQVPEYRGSCVRVLVDGKEAGIVGWEPNEVEITDLVKKEPIDLRIEVVGHRRNSHGPLHHTNDRLPWTGPGQFTSSGDQWTDDYRLVPCGLMAAPKVVVRR